MPWQAAVIVEHILDTMVHAIERGDKVEIRGFEPGRCGAGKIGSAREFVELLH